MSEHFLPPKRVFRTLNAIVVEAAQVFDPPERLTPSEAAEKYRYVYQPGAYVGKWKNSTTPYMTEPMDTFASRVYSGMIFVGPAQCGKTDALLVNTALYSTMTVPMDTIIFSPTQAAARDFSTRRIDRLHRYSKEVGKHLLKNRDSDNKFDKHYDTGVILSISWPSVTELAGRPIGRVILTDRDRMVDDVDGEGDPFDLGMKRTTTFGSFAMCVAESSPSRPLTNPKWIKTTPHEAPPTAGILALYNRGDRRRWYWPCPKCGSYFEGRFSMLVWNNDLPNKMDRADTTRLVCPTCAYHIHPDERGGMQARGLWVADGQAVDPDGVLHGDVPRSEIASYWLNGIAAAFTTWQKLVSVYIDAEQEYEKTGEEQALTKFYNTDLGEPYMPKSMEAERLPEVLKARAEEWGSTPEEPMVPEPVRALLATVDVQKNAFVVQVHGVSPGDPFDIVVIDRFTIQKSQRVDDEGDVLWVKPGTYLDDWDLIQELVMKRTYPLADGSGRRMMVKMTCCDSGGKAGVTANAYQFYRRLRERGDAARFILVKGDHTPAAPRTRTSYPDSSRRDTKAAAQGDVPVLLLSSNLLKDDLSNRLDSLIPGKGMIRFPKWLPDWFFGELCVETRTEKGWVNSAGSRNEAWDLLYYCIGLGISAYVNIGKLDWEKPPGWLKEWDANDLVIAATQTEAFAKRPATTYDFGKLAQMLG